MISTGQATRLLALTEARLRQLSSPGWAIFRRRWREPCRFDLTELTAALVARATALCIEAATANGWRVSIQTHELIGIR